MTTDHRLDRKAFLASTLAACAAVTLGACSDNGDSGGGSETTGGGTGGTGTGGASTGGTAMATGGTATGGTAAGGTATGGAGSGGASTGGSGGETGGTGGGGAMYMCTTNTNNGDHSHPLTIPPGDVARGYYDAPYVLEDGGTGHTHTLELTAYDFLYLQGGTITVESSVDVMHSHMCVLTCARV